jgi:hypothetical protein
MDDELRRRARAARAEIEARVDVETELAARPTASGIAPITTLPTRSRTVAIAGSIAAVAIAVVGGVVLFGGPGSIETSEPSAPIASVGATTTIAPSVTPTTTGQITNTTTPGPSTTIPGTTTTTSTTSLPVPMTTLPAVPAIPWRTLRWEGAGLERNCSDDEFSGCTQILADRDGSVVSYDPTTRTLTRHTTPPISTDVDESLGLVYLELLGPDQVVYLNVDPSTPAEDPIADLVAVSLAPDDAGRVLGRWSDVTDRVGDQDLVRTRDGVVSVGCCAEESRRPAPDAEVAVRWVGRDGGEVLLTGPVIRTEVDPPLLTLHRDDDLPVGTRTWTFEPPADWLPRGMPGVLPTFDGGFIAVTLGDINPTVVRGWVDGTIEMTTMDTTPEYASPIIDPNGRVIVADGDRFARFEPFADRAEFWTGRPEVGDDGNLTLPDIDTSIDNGATWSHDPVAFGNAVAGRPEVNERRTIELVQQAEYEFRVTVTTSNHFDDSVFATRFAFTLNRDDAGQFRFVSGQWAQTCQPRRGQQDFSAELCV